MKFSKNLQDLREDKDISRKELAAFLNVSLSTLGMYEQGRREPNIETLIQIADYLNISIDKLVGRNFHNSKKEEKIEEALSLKDKIDKLPQNYKDLIDYMLNKQK